MTHSDGSGSELRCSCGGRLYTLDELVAMSELDPEGVGYADMYRSFLGPFDLWCWEEDEVLTEDQCWRARGLSMPGHDEPGPRRVLPGGHGVGPMTDVSLSRQSERPA